MDICEKIAEGMLSEIGAKIVGTIIILAAATFGLKAYAGGKKVRQSQRAGKNSVQIQVSDSIEDLEQEQDAGDESVQLQKGKNQNDGQ